MRNDIQGFVPTTITADDDVSNLHGVYAIDEIMVDILSRLPPKSLMRFKCVRKSWLFLIQKDKQFFSLHNCRSKSKKKICIYYLRGRTSYFTLDLLKRSIEDVTPVHPTIHGSRLGPINGLLCYVSGRKGSVLIYNLFTKEKSPWITSNIWKNNRHLSHPLSHPTTGFGFDPVTQEHKVLLVWSINGNCQNIGVDVLTVGENTWRTTYQVLPVKDCGGRPSVHINGFIYWFIINSRTEGRLDNILAFDLGKEKFRLIKPGYGMKYRWDYEYPLEFDGQLAIMERMVNDDQEVTKMRMWTYINHEEEGDKNNYKWTWEMIELPFCMGNREIPFINSIPGKDLFTIKRMIKWNEHLLYFYDMKKKKFSEYGSLPKSKNKYEDYVSLVPFVESIYPVGAQLPVDDDQDQMITTSPSQPLVDTEEWSNTSIVIGVCCFLGLFSALYVFRKQGSLL